MIKQQHSAMITKQDVNIDKWTKLRDQVLHRVIVELSKPPSQHYLYTPTYIVGGIVIVLDQDGLILEFLGEGTVVIAIPDYKQDRWYISITFLGENRANSIYHNDFDAFWQQLVMPNLKTLEELDYHVQDDKSNLHPKSRRWYHYH